MKYDKDIIEYKRYIHNVTRDVDEYFALYDKLLPSGLGSDQTFLLHRIDNISVVMKIIERNPNAKYYVHGNAACNEALKVLEIPSIVGYKDLGWISLDKSDDSWKSFNWVAFRRHPTSRNSTRIQSILGIPVGEKLDVTFGTVMHSGCEVLSNDHIMFQGKPETLSAAAWKTSQEFNNSAKPEDKRVFVDPMWHILYKGKRLRELRKEYNNKLLVVHNF